MSWRRFLVCGVGRCRVALSSVIRMALAVLVVSLLSCTGGSNAPPASSVQPVTGSSNVVLVTLRDGATVPARPNEIDLVLLASATAEQQQAILDFLRTRNAVVLIQDPEVREFLIQVDPAELLSMLDALENFPGVRHVLPNIVARLVRNPQPTSWTCKPLVLAEPACDTWLNVIAARQAWDVTVGAGNAPIVILDGHLTGAVPLDNYKAMSGITGGPGLTSFSDTSGHGDWVASIAGARGDDGSGVAGLAWESPLYAGELPDFDSDDIGAFYLRQAIGQAARTVIAKGKVFNLSLGFEDRREGNTGDTCNVPPCYKEVDFQKLWYSLLPAIEYAAGLDHEAVFVIAAGNVSYVRNVNTPLPKEATALQRSIWGNHVLLVGGVDYGRRSVWTRGAAVTIAAPSENISLPAETGFRIGSGTSFAAPQVAGSAALVKAVNPTFTASDVRQRLLDSACQVGDTKILNASRAVNPFVTANGEIINYGTLRGELAFADYHSGGIIVQDVSGQFIFNTTPPHPEFYEFDNEPTWSPDGRQIAFSRKAADPLSAGADIGIWRAFIDGSAATRVIPGNVGQPAWSPDGERIAFAYIPEGIIAADEVFKVSVFRLFGSAHTGGAITFSTNPPSGVYDSHPTWSPDGRHLAFERHNPLQFRKIPVGCDSVGSTEECTGEQQVPGTGQHRIWVVESDGTGERMLYDGEAMSPAWSPTGEHLAFSSVSKVVVIDADENNVFFSSPPIGKVDANPTWSVDGKELVFTRMDPAVPGPTEIWRVGKTTQQLVVTGRVDTPAMSPCFARFPRPD